MESNKASHIKKLINYYDDDPRYNFTIKDSTEYTQDIYPLHLRKVCNKKYDPKYPPNETIPTRCWGQRYETCWDMFLTPTSFHNHFNYPYHDTYCGCPLCKVIVYGDDIDVLTELDYTKFKHLNDKYILDEPLVPRYKKTLVRAIDEAMDDSMFIEQDDQNKWTSDLANIEESQKIENFNNNQSGRSSFGTFIVLCVLIFIVLYVLYK